MFGTIFVLLAAGNVIWLAKKYKEIAWAISIAFVLRISAAIINLYVVTLPDGGIDATGFEYWAWTWGKDGLLASTSHFLEKGLPWFYSNVASLFYAIFGRDPLILESISVIAGVYCVVLAWKLSIQVWSSNAAAKTSAWLVTLYPVLILYSALTMREVFITLLLLYSMNHVVLWSKTKAAANAFIALLGFSLQMFLHPGMATGTVLFLGLLILYYLKILFTSFKAPNEFDIRSLLILMFSLFFGLSLFIFSTTLSFPYYSWLKFDNLIVRAGSMNIGAAAYPSWIMAENAIEFFLLLVPKLSYFLFSPFPWDISKFKHLVGLLDGLVYLMLFISIYSHRKYINSNRQALLLLVFVIFLSVIFSIAVGNFGTGLRHRSKLLPIIIVVVAPVIYKLLFSRRKK